MKRLKGFDKGLLLLVLIFLTIFVSGFVIYLKTRTDRVTDTLAQGNPLAVLLIISSEEEPIDTELFLYHPGTRKASLLNIPGNTGLLIESLNRFDRINVLYRKGSTRPFREHVEGLVGQEIPFVIDIRLDSFTNLVDLVDGVAVFQANPVEKIEGEQKVLLPSGSVLLDGSKMAQFFSYAPADELEADVIARRQKAVQGFLKKLGEAAPTIEHSQVYPLVAEAVTGNMDRAALLAFIREMSHLDVERMIFSRVLGANRQVDQQTLLFPHFNGKLLKETVAQTVETLGSSEVISEDELVVRLQILNGTTVPGLARRTATLYQSFGYDNATVGNTDSTGEEYTQIIDRRENPELARRIADLIRCSRVKSEPDLTGLEQADITIILGKDFDGRYCSE